MLNNDTERTLERVKVWDFTLDDDFQGEMKFTVDAVTGLFDGGFG